MAGNKDELVQTARNDYWGSGLSYEPVLVWMMWFPEEMKKEALEHTEWTGFYLSFTILMNSSFIQVFQKSTIFLFFSPDNGDTANSFKRGVLDCRTFIKLTNQPTNQPTNQSTNQPINQPTKQPTDQPTNQPINQPTNQPINQPTNQTTNRSTNQPTNQPINQTNNRLTNSI